MPDLQFMLNGQETTVAAPPEKAIDLLRNELGLTGTKLVCEIGGCGACTALIDGKPVETCTLETGELHNRSVITVEGIASEDGLDPIQLALIAHDAVQCGFCIPGIVVAARAFVDEWREHNGTARPEAGEVTAALDGHLCRCGAYHGIVAAIQDAAAGAFDDVDHVEGRQDATAKVAGRAEFTVDTKLPGMLAGRIVRSTEPHADVVAMNTVAAQQIPGVAAIVTVLGKDRRVRYVGQPIAAVAATDLATAKRAIAAITVTYDTQPAAIGMDAARAPDAPDVIGQRMVVTSNYEAGYFAATIPHKGNLRGPMSLLAKRRFTARKRLKAAREADDPFLVAGTWVTASQAHAAPEPHSAVALWEGDHLTVYLSTQSVKAGVKRLAKHFGLKPANVRIIAEHVGGAFGAKQTLPDPAIIAAQLAQAAQAPVRLAFDASEELAYGGYRPGAQIDLALLGTSDGGIDALEATAYMDSGDSAGQTVAGIMRFSYPGPPMQLIDYDVISNGAPAKPFHAPGAPVALFALESAVDELAARHERDPIDLRLDWEPRATRRAVYEWAAAHPLWTGRPHREDDGTTLRGVGVAFGTWHFAYDPNTRIRVATTDTGLVAETAVQEIGTGITHSIAAAVALEFGLSPNDVLVRVGDSNFGHGPTTSASRSTPSVVPTAAAAAAELRDDLVAYARENLGLEKATPGAGGIDHADGFIAWTELWPRLQGRSVTKKRPREDHVPVTPIAIEGAKLGWGITDAAHIIMVEVDSVTGTVRAVDAAVGLAAGRIHTPPQAISQVHGALARGIGQALYEQRFMDPTTGVVTSASYDEYRLLRMSEMPAVDIAFLEERYDHTPSGYSGISELAITSVPAAVANAVAAATGWRPRSLPITPDAVLAGLAHR